MKGDKLVDQFGELTLESFRLNARLIAKGDEIAGELGMTSARWQVLGTLVIAGEAITVAEIARRMGLARQSVQRIADELVKEKLMQYCDNPRHPRWKLLLPTAEGERAHALLEHRRRNWSRDVIAGLSLKELKTAADVLRKIQTRLATGDAEETKQC